jgi:hypothetical protein
MTVCSSYSLFTIYDSLFFAIYYSPFTIYDLAVLVTDWLTPRGAAHASSELVIINRSVCCAPLFTQYCVKSKASTLTLTQQTALHV